VAYVIRGVQGFCRDGNPDPVSWPEAGYLHGATDAQTGGIVCLRRVDGCGWL